MLVASPLAPQLRPGDRAPGIAPTGGPGLKLVDQRVEPAPGPIGQPAEVQFLNAVGDPVLEVAPAQDRRLAVKQFAPCRGAQVSTWSSAPRSVPGSCRSSPGLSPLPTGRMHASVGREVQVILLQAAPIIAAFALPETHERCPEDRGDLAHALVSSHVIGRQSVRAGTAAIEIADAGIGVCTHPAARSRYSVSLWGGSPQPRFCSIQPRTVSGSLSSWRAMSPIDSPSPCSRTASV
jgi:hypothetical protein